MPILIMPPLTPQISPHLIILLRILQYLHINIHNNNSFSRAPQFTQRTHKRHRNLRKPTVALTRWTRRISKHDNCKISISKKV